ncbi:MAG: class I SAM-dependent rRNA methyltransferase [Methylococcales bacterium]|nr:class I SAM-dependent rRNA methyltransferase [Methylococcales bacterium]
MKLPDLILRKQQERRLKQGHPWIFSNEIDTTRSPLQHFQPGDLVNVVCHRGQCLGTAYLNPNTLIAARWLSAQPDCALDTDFFRDRLQRALLLRQRWFNRPCYRWVYGESDALPGLVIDRFGSTLAVQINTAGMERARTPLQEALAEVSTARSVIVRTDNPLRSLEQLPINAPEITGEILPEVIIDENDCRFALDVACGQKTGWFYDHRPSRARVAALSNNKSVLDLFSYVGAFGINAAVAGASRVTCVDSSAPALDLARHNAQLNGVSQRMSFTQADVFAFLRDARDRKLEFDVIILDPPALIKRKKDYQAGIEAYRRLNALALHLLADHGVLVSASCSYHLPRDVLLRLINQAATQAKRRLVVFAQDGQGPDHPIHPAMPETEYLKSFFLAAT